MEQNQPKQHCPLFVDFTRECIRDIEVYPHEITKEMLEFCKTSQYSKCPFYKILQTSEPVCKNIKKCPAFKNFQSEDFDEFVKISNTYCTSPDHTKCKRYIIKESEKPVPIDLHPDGSVVKKWKEKTKR